MEVKEIKKQIVIFGGSFNPPLNSHFSLAEQLLNTYKQIEKIIFVPVNSKYEKAGLAGNEDRFKMLKLVCDKNERFEASRLEIDKDRQLYTIETLTEFQKIYPEYEICFLMGTDNLIDLNTWYGKEELVSKFRMYIFERSKDKVEEIINQYEFLKENRNAFINANNKIRSNLSSTFVREEIKKGNSIKYLIPDEVIEYIKEKNLYEN